MAVFLIFHVFVGSSSPELCYYFVDSHNGHTPDNSSQLHQSPIFCEDNVCVRNTASTPLLHTAIILLSYLLSLSSFFS